ncbi:MAG: hypothetical protein Tsb0014_21670 [Pleurocapsa sp.]
MASIKLLVIDDDDDNRTLIDLTLKITANWKVILAENGIEGISKAESEQPDVILLDLVMSDVDGLSVYEILKHNLFTCTIPVIFITAMVNDKVLRELRKTGANGIITKPFNTVTLAEDVVRMANLNSFSNGKKNKLKNWDKKYCSVDHPRVCMLKTEKERDSHYLIV